MTKLPRIKICGITRLEDAELAADLGAWAIGFIFYSRSSRAVSPAVARSIRAGVAGRVEAVGVFVNSPMSEVAHIANQCGLEAVQLHGEETPEYCRQLRELLPDKKIIKALRVAVENDLRLADAFHETCDALLLDSHSPHVQGGSGVAFDWEKIKTRAAALNSDLIVAGGLTAENLCHAIELFHPYALDVSSGVESRPGIKEERKMRRLFETAAGCQ